MDMRSLLPELGEGLLEEELTLGHHYSTSASTRSDSDAISNLPTLN